MQLIAVYEALLSEVSYQDTGTDASTGSHPVRVVTWTVNDGTNGYSTTSQVTIDRAPVASNSTASDLAGSTVTATAASGVLAHATDADGDSLTVTAVSDTTSGAGCVGTSLAGAYGHLTLNANGSYSYVADNSAAIAAAPTGSHLQDTFSYTVSDGNGGTATATLTVTLDRAPVASNSTASDAAGSTVTATAASGVLSHATDADGDSSDGDRGERYHQRGGHRRKLARRRLRSPDAECGRFLFLRRRQVVGDRRGADRQPSAGHLQLHGERWQRRHRDRHSHGHARSGPGCQQFHRHGCGRLDGDRDRGLRGVGARDRCRRR